jgi:rubrerythrin
MLLSALRGNTPRLATRWASLSVQGQSILDHLLKTESDAEAYYLDLASKAKNEGFKNIFLMVAKEEAKHTKWLLGLAKDGRALGATVSLNKSLLGDTKCVFQSMMENRKDLNKLCADQMELYRAARDLEAQSRDLYVERAKQATDPELKKLLLLIALEEGKHCKIIDGLVQFVSEAPGGGLVDMEALDFWVNIDEPLASMGKL